MSIKRRIRREVRERERVARALAEQAIVLAQQTAALQATNAALVRSNLDLDQFAYVAAHDLKSPLRGICNLSEWLEEDLGAAIDDRAREHLRLLRGRVHRLEALIDGILAYARAGRSEEISDVDVDVLVRETLAGLAAASDAFVIDTPMPTLRTARLALQQVWTHLIGNAQEHAARAGARVRLSATSTPEGWLFAVRDNGDGIAPEYHEKIFDIFQRLETRERVEGAGIGLAMVRKLVELRGGRVWVESQPGAGATFKFLWKETA